MSALYNNANNTSYASRQISAPREVAFLSLCSEVDYAS